MKQLLVFISILISVNVITAQRAPPGINPNHYQHQQQQFQQVPVQQVPGQQYQQAPPPQYQQVPQQQYQAPAQPQQPPIQHQPQGGGHHHGGHHGQPQQILNAANIQHEKEHIAEHLEVPIDTSKMTEQELQFHYFKMHDGDNNNKLDGCELIKSLIHWHEQGSKEKQGVEEKVFKDDELVNLIDPILNVDDTDRDGYIDYPEFIRAQQKATGGQPQQQPGSH
ncbi:multiple coagulation factor deficiency protein 2 homolog isoform X2 [Cylas formicarius]|uniref:multiple coagulation factor deficiency protein 2 homolog isoform X2 n=1 Tax=Cylas formicarius TaxID=197179 RepID=UPI002958376F|nr:multiple coagulation factor deficiency protein 2 homolog isoform X2 [Cylas formicarius]